MTATESQATPGLDLDSPAIGPQPPGQGDLWRAQDAPLEADRAGAGEAEYQRLLTERIQTELAYRAAYDRDLFRELEAGAGEPEPEAEP